ncbi:MAG: alpha/beta hydrolase [Crocinitomicaceae bacterium]
MSNSGELLPIEIAGKGPFLVLIHGFLEANTMWENLGLENHFTTVKIELPGHGKAPFIWEEQTISYAATQVKKVLEANQIQEFHLMGHSLGGYVALEFASLFGLPEKLILMHSNFWQDDAQKQKDRERVAKIVKTNKSLFLQEAIPALFLEPKKQFSAINNLLLEAKTIKSQSIANCSIAMKDRKDHTQTVVKFRAELLIIQGEKDKLVPAHKMLKICAELSLNVTAVKNCGHMGQHEKPLIIQKTIVGFLNPKSGHN